MGFLAGVLATLGLVAAVLTVAALSVHRRFRDAGGAFRCRVRTPSGGRRRRWHRWRRWPAPRTRGRWVHDVLLLQSGPLGLSLVPLAARIAPGAVLRPVSVAEARGLGPRPWALLLTTEDRTAVDV